MADVLQILVPAIVGAASGYFVNQLPPLRTFRGSRLILIALVIELALFGSIWGWLSSEPAQTSTHREGIAIIGWLLAGAFVMGVLQLIVGLGQNKTASAVSDDDQVGEQLPDATTGVNPSTRQGDRMNAPSPQGDRIYNNYGRDQINIERIEGDPKIGGS